LENSLVLSLVTFQLRNSSFQSQQIHLADEQVRQLESVFYAILKNGAVSGHVI
jgi:hypothetical protein